MSPNRAANEPATIDPERLADQYLRALGEGDADAVLRLFTADAVVDSPLYGSRPARVFFPGLFADTSASHLTLRAVASGTTPAGAALITIWFHFDWRLASGEAAPFEVVDVLELAANGLIERLRIVYDTVEVRPAFERETGTRSWRPSDAERP
jgi:hypothetical protein